MAANTLPQQATPFVGRNDELAEIARLLADPTCRLLTLTGPGGVGKTRLALEAAAQAVEHFPYGVYSVFLAPLRSTELLLTSVGEAFGIAFEGEQEPKAQLLDYLRERELLLVMDNFEHLLDGAGLLSEALGDAPEMKILTTSHERLRLREEVVLEVQGLIFPQDDAVEAPEDYSAVQLFLQNARRARASFVPTRTESASIARICRMVEGNPLAIELASAWVRVLSCAEIAAELERSLDILATTLRNIPEKHRTMRAALEYSWNLLSEAEKAAFRKLAVFRGGFRKAAAQQVAGASLLTLSSLVDKSLLRVNTSGQYEIHELLRQYAEEQLELAGEADAIRDAHSTHYAEFLQGLAVELKGPNQITALAEIEAEIDNVRLGWGRAVARGMEREILQSLDSLALFYQIRSRFQEAEEAFQIAANRFDDVENIVLANALLLQEWFCHYDADQIKRQRRVVRGVSILRRLGFPKVVAMLFGIFCIQAEALGGYEEVQQWYRDQLSIFRQRNDAWGTAWVLHGLGHLAYRYDHFEEAQQLQQESLETFRAIGDRWGSTWALNSLAEWAHVRGAYREAERFFREALAICKEVGDPGGIAWSLGRLGTIADALQEYANSRQFLSETLKTRLEAGSSWPISDHEIYLMARLLEAEGQTEQAVEMLAFFLSHPDLALPLHRLKDKAAQYLNNLEVKLAPDVFAAAVQRGAVSDLETVAAFLLEQLSRAEREIDVAVHLFEGRYQTSDQPLLEPLSKRELEILRLIADGLSNEQIAARLYLTQGTIKWHAKQIYGKLYVHSRTQAIARARELKLLA